MQARPYPLLLTPVYKDYIWGGDRIRDAFARKIDLDVCAESWEITDRPEGMGVVENGPSAGTSLHDLVLRVGPELLGTSAPPAGDRGAFPLLIKIIDARKRLSVQVHPDDAAALEHGGEAKTESWYVLDADPGAQVFAGLKDGTNEALFLEALAEERLEDVLAAIPVTPGQAIFIPGGRVHAIAEGCLLLEVQQNSNTTYRVYDWGRTGKDGKPRALHLEQALQVIKWNDPTPSLTQLTCVEDGANSSEQVLACPYFRIIRLRLTDTRNAQNDGSTFHCYFAARGSVRIDCDAGTTIVPHGRSVLLPAALPAYALSPIADDAVLLRSSLM